MASKKFGRSGLATDSRLLPLLDEELRRSVRRDDPLTEAGVGRDDDAEVEDATALEEKLRTLFKGAGSRGLVLLLLRWCLAVPL